MLWFFITSPCASISTKKKTHSCSGSPPTGYIVQALYGNGGALGSLAKFASQLSGEAWRLVAKLQQPPTENKPAGQLDAREQVIDGICYIAYEC